jgi:hypothetical protein
MGGQLDPEEPIPAACCETLGDVRETLRRLIRSEIKRFSEDELFSGMPRTAAVFTVMGEYVTGCRAYLPIEIEPDPEDPSLYISPKDYVESVANISINEALVFPIREIRTA